MMLDRARLRVQFSLFCLALTLGVLCPPLTAATQIPAWEWVSGSSSLNSTGQYGMLGQPSPSNTPGARANASHWTDGSGNFWLFGGYGNGPNGPNTYLNDLWEFNPLTQAWTCVAGDTGAASTYGDAGVYGQITVAAQGNTPGGRGNAAAWTDRIGNLWLFGGYGIDSQGNRGYLNDLWEFSASAQEWIWMGGSSTIVNLPADSAYGQPGVYGNLHSAATGNIPGGRSAAKSWTDSSGNLWLWGGYGIDSASNAGYLNDVWEYSPANGEWAWMGGSSTVPGFQSGQPGNYGLLNTLATGNIPSGRMGSSSWTDASGNVWLFGGYGADSTGQLGMMNDFWEFQPSTDEWAWMGGSSTTISQPNGNGGRQGVYGNLGSPASGNLPGARYISSSWTDSSGNLWLFGGQGFDSNDTLGVLNDLWKFKPGSQEWIWMGGASTIPGGDYGSPAVYGTMIEPEAQNIPGGRTGPVEWTDGSGNFWLFGGSGVAADGVQIGNLNDLWEAGNGLLFTSSVQVGFTITQYVAQAQAETVRIRVDGFTGQPAPTGTVTLTSGNYTSGPAALTSYSTYGYIEITIPAGALSIGTDTVTATYVPDTGSSTIYKGSSGTSVAYVSQNLPIGVSVQAYLRGATNLAKGQALPVTVSVSGTGNNPAPTGTVVLTADRYTSGPVTLSGGIASFTVPAGSFYAGTETITAVYTPDAASIANNYGSDTGTDSVTVVSYLPATVTVTYVPNPSQNFAVGQLLQVTVTTSVPTGEPTLTGAVTLTSGSYSSGDVPLTNGSAVINIPGGSLAVGTDTLTANYAPDSASSPIYTIETGSNSIIVQSSLPHGLLILPAATSITNAQSLQVTIQMQENYGDPTPTGTVTLTSGSYSSGALTLTPATFTSGSLTWTIAAASTTIPAGTLSSGTNTLTATYTPGAASNGIFANGSGSTTITVTSKNPVVTVTPSATSILASQGLQVAVSVSGGTGNATPTGSITLVSAGFTLGTPVLTNGTATVNIPANTFAPGSDTITATYTPDAGSVALYTSAAGLSTITVASYTPVVTVTPSASNILASQAMQVTVSVYGGVGRPTAFGSVTLSGGGYSSGPLTLAQPSDSATFSIPANALNYGLDTLTATYTPDAASLASYVSATGSNTVTVGAGTPLVTVTPASSNISVTQALTVTVAVAGGTGTPTAAGTVALSSGSYNSGAVSLANGAATINVPANSLSPGSDTLTAIYTAGGASTGVYSNANGTASVTVSAVTPVVTVTPALSSIFLSQSLQVTVAVTGGSGNPTPTGSVTLTSGTYSSGAVALTSGGATIQIPGNLLSAGPDALNAAYAPDTASAALYNVATGNGSVVVSALNPTPALSSISPAIATAGGAAFTLTLNGSGFFTGSTVNWNGAGLTTNYVSASRLTALVPAADIAGVGSATVSVVNATPGGGTSGTLNFQINSAGAAAPAFSSTTASVTAGTAATYLVTLPATPSAVSVTCLNLPSGATCSYAGATGLVSIATSASTPAGTYQVTVVFTETVAVTGSLILLPLLLLPLSASKRRLNAGRVWLIALFGLALAVGASCGAGCGGGGTSLSTPQTQQITTSGVVGLTVR